MKYTLTLIFISFVGYLHPVNKIQSYRLQNIDTAKYAILNFQSQHYPSIFNKDSKSYVLSISDIKEVEDLLKKEVSIINKHAKVKMIKNPSKFYKQLIAVYNLNGEKEVWVNCLCNINNEPDWKKRIVKVLDGGPCYFNFKVNLNTSKIYDFEINGVA